jgi:hypothetical protein
MACYGNGFTFFLLFTRCNNIYEHDIFLTRVSLLAYVVLLHLEDITRERQQYKLRISI